MTDLNSKVSIVVTTRNESQNIERCLESIVLQTYRNIELIVVDNQSTDDTKALASKFTSDVYDVGPERCAQRNYGLQKIASGYYGMFVDADMILSPSLVEKCVQTLSNNPCSSLYIPEIILGKRLFNRARRFERLFYEGTAIDALRFFRISDYKLIGGFDERHFEQAGAEDWDFSRRLCEVSVPALLDCHEKHPIASTNIGSFIMNSIPKHELERYTKKTCFFHNEVDLTFLQFLRKKLKYSDKFQNYIHLWGEKDPIVKMQFGLKYRFVVVFFEDKKWKEVMLSPHMFCIVILIRLLLGVSLLFYRTFQRVHKIRTTLT